MKATIKILTNRVTTDDVTRELQRRFKSQEDFEQRLLIYCLETAHALDVWFTPDFRTRKPSLIFHDQYMDVEKDLNNIKVEMFWRKLNRVPHAIYARFQRMFARRNHGQWIRGVTMTNGTIKFNLE